MLAGAGGEWALVLTVVLLAISDRRHLLRLRAVTLLAAALTPLAITWYLVTAAAATSG